MIATIVIGITANNTHLNNLPSKLGPSFGISCFNLIGSPIFSKLGTGGADLPFLDANKRWVAIFFLNSFIFFYKKQGNTLIMDRPKRERRAPKPIYVPDMEFLERKYFNKKDLEEDEKMTKMYGNDDYVPSSELSDSEEEEQIEYFSTKGKDIDSYYINGVAKKRKINDDDESYSPHSSSTEDDDYISSSDYEEETEEEEDLESQEEEESSDEE